MFVDCEDKAKTNNCPIALKIIKGNNITFLLYITLSMVSVLLPTNLDEAGLLTTNLRII